MARGGRKRRSRSIKKTIYIFTEGKTEKNYFQMLNKKYNASANVKVQVDDTRKQGLSLLYHAQGKIRTLPRSERDNLGGVYIIFDRDDLSYVDVEKTMNACKREKIHVGYSNRCFEVWMLAHYTHNIPIARKELYRELEKHLGCTDYSHSHKDDAEIVNQLQDRVIDAIKNTERFKDMNQDQIQEKPYTNIGNLIQEIYNQRVY